MRCGDFVYTVCWVSFFSGWDMGVDITCKYPGVCHRYSGRQSLDVPLIWIWLYTLGHWMGAGNADTAAQSLEFEVFFTGMFNGVLMMDMGYLVEHVWPVLWPMLVGAIPTMLFVWFLFYLPLNSLIHTYQLRRLRRMRRNEYKGES